MISSRRNDFPGRAFVALLAGATILSFGGWLIRLADVGPVASAFWRLTLAFPLLLLVVRGTGQPFPRDPRLITLTLVGGVLFAANLAIWHSGVLLTRLANSLLFGNVSSFLFAGYGFMQLRRLPGPAQRIALLLAAGGVVLLLGRSYELSSEHVLGDFLSIVAGVCYTGYLIAMDQARGRVAALPTLALSTAAGIPILLAASLLLGQQFIPSDWWPLILLAFGSQLIGQGLMVYAIGHLSPVLVGLTLLIQPAIGATIGWIFYNERLDVPDLIGMAAIGIALVLIRSMPKRADASESRVISG